MVFPIGDDNSDMRIVPVVNYVLIALNVLVFVLFQGMGTNDKFTYSFSTVPVEIRTGKDVVSDDHVVVDPATGQELMAPGLQPTPWSVYLTLLTSMFMHGGTAHLLGNMWFLWIFGDNVEDRMGHPRYLSFYLLTGLAASMSHVVMNLHGPGSLIPSLGASGAISGVMGAYLHLPESKGASGVTTHANRHSGIHGRWSLVPFSTDQRYRITRRRISGKRSGVCGPHRRFCCRRAAREAVCHRQA